MDIEAAAAIGDGESLNRNPSKKSFSQVFQGMIRRGKKKTNKEPRLAAQKPWEQKRKLNCGSSSLR